MLVTKTEYLFIYLFFQNAMPGYCERSNLQVGPTRRAHFEKRGPHKRSPDKIKSNIFDLIFGAEFHRVIGGDSSGWRQWPIVKEHVIKTKCTIPEKTAQSFHWNYGSSESWLVKRELDVQQRPPTPKVVIPTRFPLQFSHAIVTQLTITCLFFIFKY